MSIKVVVGAAAGTKKDIVQIAGHSSVEGQKLKASHKVEPVAQVVTGKPMCNVGMKLGYTKNIGQFESLKFEVSLYMPCTHKQLDATALFVQGWCDDKLTRIVKDAEAELGA